MHAAEVWLFICAAVMSQCGGSLLAETRRKLEPNNVGGTRGREAMAVAVTAAESRSTDWRHATVIVTDRRAGCRDDRVIKLSTSVCSFVCLGLRHALSGQCRGGQ